MKEDMILKPDQINVSIRSLKKIRPDIYQLLLPDLKNLSPDKNLPEEIPSKYFGEIFQKFINSFSERIFFTNYDGVTEQVYVQFAFYYNPEKKTFSIHGSELQEVLFNLETGAHTVSLSFYDYPLDKANAAMIRLIIALQIHYGFLK